MNPGLYYQVRKSADKSNMEFALVKYAHEANMSVSVEGDDSAVYLTPAASVVIEWATRKAVKCEGMKYDRDVCMQSAVQTMVQQSKRRMEDAGLIPRPN